MTYYGRWTYKYEEAARRGAAGVLVVHETEPASYGWATVKNSNTNTMFDIVRKDPASAHAPMEGWIQRDVAVALFRSAGLDFEAAKQAARRRDFQPMDLKATMTASAEPRRGHQLVQRRRPHCRQEPPGRDRHLHRPPRPSRHWPAGRQWRPHL